MFDSLPHRRVALVALAALVALSGAAASAPATADVSPTEIDRSPASMAETTTAAENASVEFVYEGERLTLQQADDQTVQIRTNADPGTGLKVELLVEGAFAALAFAPVAEDGTATAAFDLRQYDPGTEFALVAPDGTRADGVLVEESNATDAEELSIAFGHEPVVLRPAANQTIRVETNAEPGTQLDVEVESETHLWTAAAETGADGTATAEFNMSAIEPGAELEIGARSDDAEAEARGLVVNETATVNRDGTLTVAEPGSNYTVVGKTDLYPGTEIDVRLTAADSSFSASETVTVGEDDAPLGTNAFEATFDASSVPEDAELSVEVAGVPRSIDVAFVVTDDGEQTVFAFSETPANATLLESDATALLVEQASNRSLPEKTLLVEAGPDRTIRGETNLQPGTELEVRVEGEINVQNSIDLSETVTVREDGTFEASMDFDGTDPGTEMTIEVAHPSGPSLAHVDGRVVEESALRTTTASTTHDESESAFTTDDTTDRDDNDGTVPGFGVPAALVALLGTLVLARRRS